MKSIIKVNNLTFGYRSAKSAGGGADKKESPRHKDGVQVHPTDSGGVLKDLSFEAEQGRFVSIVGPNGAGKTTLLNLLCGLFRPQAGRIEIDSEPIQNYSAKKLARKIAVVRQEFVPVFDFTVAQIVSMARLSYSGSFGFETKTDKQIIAEALELTDTKRFAGRGMRNLSSGERQRVFIARAIAQDAPILLLDEPTNFLDIKHQVDIFDLLKTIQKEKGKTIIAVTHDINLAVQYADYALLIGLQGGYKFGSAKEIFTKAQIELLFDVKVFSGRINEGNFFLPLGKYAKDGGKTG
jgi:iron complex transport system ATP-binding protein